MEIKSLVDLNSLRSAPILSNRQTKKLLEELETKILNSDWITIGIMASDYNGAIEALKSISRKYTSIQFKNLDSLHADGNVFLKGNQKTGNVFISSNPLLGRSNPLLGPTGPLARAKRAVLLGRRRTPNPSPLMGVVT